MITYRCLGGVCCVIVAHWSMERWYTVIYSSLTEVYPDNKVHGANMGPIWGRQDPGGPHVGPMNFAIWVITNTGSR